MLSQTYYILRSKADGRYVTARPNPDAVKGYLLLFREHYEALSYLNKHAGEIADRFAVESIPGSQLKAIIQRWGFAGLGMVQDALIPSIDFVTVS